MMSVPSIENHTAKINPTPVSYDALLDQFRAPEGKKILLHGSDDVFRVALALAAHVMAAHELVAVVDGCNRFNVLSLAKFARQRKINADDFLTRIYVSRGFTCYQMEAAITERLPAFLARHNARFAMVLGLLDTMYDTQASARDVTGIVEQINAALTQLSRGPVTVLNALVSWPVEDPARRRLFAMVQRAADAVYHVSSGADGRPRVLLERAGPQERLAAKNATV